MTREPLTEREKWQCTASWLNELYLAFMNESWERLNKGHPCAYCERLDTCPTRFPVNPETLEPDIYDPDFATTVPLLSIFKVIEKYAGVGTILGPVLPASLLTNQSNDDEVLPVNKDSSPLDICPHSSFCMNNSEMLPLE